MVIGRFMNKNTKPKRNTGVSLDHDVTEYLDVLSRETDRSRSWLINAIVRQHVQLVKEKRAAAVVEPELAVIRL